MSAIQPSQVKPVELWCRLAMAAGVLSGDGFCAFDFPDARDARKRSTLSGAL